MEQVLNFSDYSGIADFADAIRIAFTDTQPPIKIGVDNRELLDLLAKEFKKDNGFYGHSVLCKKEGGGTFISYSVRELYYLNPASYPIIFSFKKLGDLEDFSTGWLKLADSEPEPQFDTQEKKNEPKPTPEAKEQSTMNNGSVNETRLVNPLAESILNTALRVWLVFGWIAGAAAVVYGVLAGYYEIANEGAWGLLLVRVLLGAIGGALIVFLFYFVWASWKIFINMSRNLFIVNEKLESISQKLNYDK